MKPKISFFILVAFILQSYMYSQSSNYVTVEGQKFMLNENQYYPMTICYNVNITKNHTNNTYYLSPHWNYSDIWGYPNTGGEGRFIYSSTDDIGVSHRKLVNDMSKMAERKINTIRVNGLEISFSNNGSIIYPGGCSESVYFQKIEELLTIMQTYNLKAILCIYILPNYPEYDMTFNDFLCRIATRLKNYTSLMAYSFLGEPATYNGGYHKFLNSSRISNWHYSIKKNSPNHLTTIGYGDIAAFVDWDPVLHPIDFISQSVYAWSKDVQLSNNVTATFLKWYSNNIQKPWIVGETGYSGTNIYGVHDDRVGTEIQQKDFANFSMQRALDCNCSGYSWWQFQDVHWNDPFEDYLGTITYFGNHLEREKSVIQSFKNFNPTNKNISNCIKPSNYYNMWGKTFLRNQGRVVDNNGKPIKDAVIDRSGTTFTDENGYFKYYSGTTGTYYTLSITALGYNVVQIPNPATDVGTITLYPVNYMNCWFKKSSNNNDWIGGWKIRDYDKFYKGDFNGDGRDELLCIQNLNNGWADLYNYNNGTWSYSWTNNGNGWLGGWYIRKGDKFYVGDFNGDGKDELLCIQDVNNGWADLYGFNNGQWTYLWTNNGNGTLSGWAIRAGDKFYVGDFNGDKKDDLICVQNLNNGWANIHNFNNGNWSYIWTNNGNGKIGEWAIRAGDKFYIGDFNGNGKDELFCIQYTGGSNDWMTLLSYNINWTRIWCNNGSSSHAIYPYRNKLVVGDFDGDNKDEILGIHTWATLFDLKNNDWFWSWSTEGVSILGDWIVNFNHTTLSFKGSATDPSYFLVLSQNTESDFCNLYMKNPLEGTTMINTFTVPFSVTSSTVGEPNKWNVQGCNGSDKAYKFYLPQTTRLNATLCSNLTNYDTKLEIFKEDGTRTGYYNDDYGCIYNNHSSTINNMQLSEGYYYAVVDGYCGATGNFELTVSLSDAKNIYKETVNSDTCDVGKYLIEMEYPYKNVQIFPNPATNNINIIMPDILDYTIILVDIMGRTLKYKEFNTHQANIDCSDLQSGIYILKITSYLGNYQQKILINK